MPQAETVDSIFKLVEGLLEGAAGKQKVEQLLDLLEWLVHREEELEQLVGKFGRRPDVRFYGSVGSLTRKRPHLDVRIQGRSCGTLSVAPSGARSFSPRKWLLSNAQRTKAEWGDREVARLLKRAALEIKPRRSEATIESALLVEMAKDKGTTKPQLLHGQQPVRLAGLPFQFPLPISARETPEVAEGNAAGHADVIARVKGHGANRLRVLEVKKPGADDSGHALEQAVAYCAAVNWLMQRHAGVLRPALGFGGKRAIPIDAAAFVDFDQKDSVLENAGRLSASNQQHLEMWGYFYSYDDGRLTMREVQRIG